MDFLLKVSKRRIEDTKAKLVITADGQFRGGKLIPLKSAVDDALMMGKCESVDKIVVYNRANTKIKINTNDILWEAPQICIIVILYLLVHEDPLFILIYLGLDR